MSGARKSGFGTVILKMSREHGSNRKIKTVLGGIDYVTEVIAVVSFIVAYKLVKAWLELGVEEGMASYAIVVSEPLFRANPHKRRFYVHILSVVQRWVVHQLANTQKIT